MSDQVELRLMGGFELRLTHMGRTALRRLPYQRARALLAIVLLQPRAHTRDELADLLWPDSPRTDALTALRRMLHVLKTALGPAAQRLLVRRTDIQWQGPLVCDALDLLHWQATQRLDAATAATLAPRLLGSYQGPLLHGLEVPSAGFEHWLHSQRGHLQLQVTRLGLALAHHHHHQGRAQDEAWALQQVLRIDPLHEDAMAQLLRLRLRQGERHAGRQEWALFCQHHQEAVDEPPTAELQALAQALDQPSPVPARSLPDKLPLTVLHLQHVQDPTLSLEQAWDARAAWRQRCTERVLQAAGHVLQAPTPGLSACFGYPQPQETACEQAVLTALDLASPDTAAGVAWGWVLIPTQATAPADTLSPHHWPDLNLTVTQEAQHLAQQAHAGQVQVSEAVYDSVRLQFDWAQPQPPHHPRRPHPEVHPLAHTLEGRLWGRAAELTWLDTQAEQTLTTPARAGPTGHTVRWALIEAEAGMGKSHLLRHWLSQHAPAGQAPAGFQHRVMVQARQAWAYSPFKALEGLGDALGWRLGSLDVASPVRRRAWAREAAQQFAAPTLWVMEDAHWLDPSSIELLQALADVELPAPCLVVLTARPGHPLAASLGPIYRLPPLPPRELDALAAELAPHRTQHERKQAIARCGGNTLHLKALLAIHDSTLRTPTRLTEALQAQTQSLGPWRLVAEWASVLGTRFALDDLDRLWRSPPVASTLPEALKDPAQLPLALRQLERAGLLQTEGDTHLRFHHSLQCEALIAGIHSSRLRTMHAQVLDCLWPALSPSAPQADHAQMAQRCELAARLADARRWRQAALAQAQGRHAFAEMAHHAQAWLRLLNTGTAPAHEVFTALMHLASAQAAQLGYGSATAQATYAKALDQALRLNQPQAEFAATWALWLGASSASGYDRALSLATRLQHLADPDPQPQALARYALGNTWVCQGQFNTAVQVLAPLSQGDWPLWTDRPEDPVAHGLAFLALAHGRLAQPEQARRAAALALRRARRVQLPFTLGFVCSLVALMHVLHHDWAAVARHGQRISRVGQDNELALWQASGALMQQVAAIAQGDAQAWDTLEATLRGLPAIMSGVEGLFLTALVTAGVYSQAWDRVAPWAARGLALREERQDRFFESGFLQAQAQCQARLSNPKNS